MLSQYVNDDLAIVLSSFLDDGYANKRRKNMSWAVTMFLKPPDGGNSGTKSVCMAPSCSHLFVRILPGKVGEAAINP